MKRTSLSLYFIGVVLCFASASCINSSGSTSHNDSLQMMSDPNRATTASFPDSVQDFGNVVRGKQVQLVFHVLNTGAKPLLIADVRPSCGCTVADFTKSAIEPGKTGEVTGTFDSNHGAPGHIHKTITVTTNTSQQRNILSFTGEVAAKPGLATASK